MRPCVVSNLIDYVSAPREDTCTEGIRCANVEVRALWDPYDEQTKFRKLDVGWEHVPNFYVIAH